jgi:type VI secretion system protein ImpA
MQASVLQAWPESIHPQLVIEGEVDPAVRSNALAALADPEGLLGDVRDIVVASGTALRLSVRDVERAFAVPRLADAPSPESVRRQLDAMRAAGDARSAVNRLAEAARHAYAIDAWSKRQQGEDAPSLQGLLRLLDLFVVPERGRSSAEEGALKSVIGQQGPRARRPAAGRAGSAALSLPDAGGATREDVLQSVRAARDWFEAHEPSSPVAVLLRQAERMVGKRFSQVADAIPLDLLQKWEAQEDSSSKEAAA